jgi:hypothetical protein
MIEIPDLFRFVTEFVLEEGEESEEDSEMDSIDSWYDESSEEEQASAN